jgi:hypothetical protein
VDFAAGKKPHDQVFFAAWRGRNAPSPPDHGEVTRNARAMQYYCAFRLMSAPGHSIAARPAQI